MTNLYFCAPAKPKGRFSHRSITVPAAVLFAGLCVDETAPSPGWGGLLREFCCVLGQVAERPLEPLLGELRGGDPEPRRVLPAARGARSGCPPVPGAKASFSASLQPDWLSPCLARRGMAAGMAGSQEELNGLLWPGTWTCPAWKVAPDLPCVFQLPS